ncbi:helix-turn-helix domain-containing protein [Bacillus sp. EB01]|uniref:helix-turn-helix domain-containing protein n=1 Tax=Bacillus sp. EB01 TaxID=1347086 RepID=UPI0005C44A71|nr:helix-turn-helix domain-containing protein [Bacillus sp. EB01]
MSKINLLDELGLENKLTDEFLNIPDGATLRPSFVAEVLNVHIETVRRWLRSGKLKSYSFGGKYAIKGSDFKEFLLHSMPLTKAQRDAIS